MTLGPDAAGFEDAPQPMFGRRLMTRPRPFAFDFRFRLPLTIAGLVDLGLFASSASLRRARWSRRTRRSQGTNPAGGTSSPSRGRRRRSRRRRETRRSSPPPRSRRRRPRCAPSRRGALPPRERETIDSRGADAVVPSLPVLHSLTIRPSQERKERKRKAKEERAVKALPVLDDGGERACKICARVRPAAAPPRSFARVRFASASRVPPRPLTPRPNPRPVPSARADPRGRELQRAAAQETQVRVRGVRVRQGVRGEGSHAVVQISEGEARRAQGAAREEETQGSGGAREEEGEGGER